MSKLIKYGNRVSKCFCEVIKPCWCANTTGVDQNVSKCTHVLLFVWKPAIASCLSTVKCLLHF